MTVVGSTFVLAFLLRENLTFLLLAQKKSKQKKRAPLSPIAPRGLAQRCLPPAPFGMVALVFVLSPTTIVLTFPV
jgi:hypothetical protein